MKNINRVYCTSNNEFPNSGDKIDVSDRNNTTMFNKIVIRDNDQDLYVCYFDEFGDEEIYFLTNQDYPIYWRFHQLENLKDEYERQNK